MSHSKVEFLDVTIKFRVRRDRMGINWAETQDLLNSPHRDKIQKGKEDFEDSIIDDLNFNCLEIEDERIEVNYNEEQDSDGSD